MTTTTHTARALGTTCRTALLTMLGTLVLHGSVLPQGNTWVQKAGLPSATAAGRSGATAFTIDTKAYIFSGSLADGTVTNEAWEFDPATNAWAQKASMPNDWGRRNATGFSTPGSGFITTGIPQSTSSSEIDRRSMACFIPSTNTWSRKALFPGSPRWGAISFYWNKKAYVGLGSGGKDFYSYDPSTDKWTRLNDFPGVSRTGAVAFSTTLGCFVGLGSETATIGYPKDLWKYDATADQWTRKRDLPSAGRGVSATFVVNDKCYVAGGAMNLDAYNELWQYDPAVDTWTRKADIGTESRASAVGFALGSKGYIGTGNVGPNGGTPRQDLWAYDPATNTWTRKQDMGQRGGPRHSAAGFSIGTMAYMGTGWDGYSYYKDLWQYNAVTNVWTQKADLAGGARETATGLAIGTKGYICLGNSPMGDLQDLWEYDPATNSWTAKAAFRGSARHWAAAFSIGAKGYVGTGLDAQGAIRNDFWEYDPATNTWTQKADFAGGPRRNVAAFSVGGKGYFGTGFGTSMTKDLWEYDATSNAWTRKADFGGSARHFAVGFTADMRGYIAAGSDGSTNLDDVWQYEPATNTWSMVATFNGMARHATVAFGTGSKGFMTTGISASAYLSDLWEYAPPVACQANSVRLNLITDLNGSETSWDIIRTGETNPVAEGHGYAKITNTSVYACLLPGNYSLRVRDSGSNGMGSGGYQLLDANNKRIVDNLNNPTAWALSQAKPTFDLPLGTNELEVGSCDQLNLTATSVIKAVIDPLVTAQYGVQNATSGYEFQVFDPNGSYLGSSFQSHIDHGSGFPTNAPNAEKCAYLKLSTIYTPPIPLGRLLNVRVRARINGVDKNFGPACRLKVVS